MLCGNNKYRGLRSHRKVDLFICPSTHLTFIRDVVQKMLDLKLFHKLLFAFRENLFTQLADPSQLIYRASPSPPSAVPFYLTSNFAQPSLFPQRSEHYT